MRSSDVLDLLVEIEQRFAVDEWKIDGVRIWPLLRVRIYTDILNFKLVEQAPARGIARIAVLAVRIIRASIRVTCASLRDARANASTRRPVDAVFFSDGVSFVCLGGQWHDKIFAPLIAWLRRKGMRYLVLTPLSHTHQPRFTPSAFIQPALDMVNASASLSRRMPEERSLPDIEAVLETLAAGGMQAVIPSQAGILILWRRLRFLSGYFDRILARSAPRYAFVNTYYSLEGMAFVLACRQRGIRVADVQHGVQGENHVAYGRWSRMPDAGYELLPDEFWVWGGDEAKAIKDWRPRIEQIHIPVETGNMWLEIWKNGSEDFVEHEIARARNLRREGTDKHILVTFQWGLADEETEKILRAVRISPRSWCWWLRLHPLVAHDRTAFKNLVSRFELENVEVDLPTDLPLHALLALADAHVTHSSSTVIEAAEFGLSSVVTSDYGAELFSAPSLIAWVHVARTDREIAAAIASLPAVVRNSERSTAIVGSNRAMQMAFPSADKRDQQ